MFCNCVARAEFYSGGWVTSRTARLFWPLARVILRGFCAYCYDVHVKRDSAEQVNFVGADARAAVHTARALRAVGHFSDLPSSS